MLVDGARVSLHVHGVRTGLRLGDGEREQQTARLPIIAHHVGELPLIGELPNDGEVEQVVLERQRSTGTSGQLLDDKRLGAQAERPLGIFELFQSEVQVDEPLDHLVGQPLVATPLAHVLGSERLFAESAERRHESALFVGQLEIHGCPSSFQGPDVCAPIGSGNHTTP